MTPDDRVPVLEYAKSLGMQVVERPQAFDGHLSQDHDAIFVRAGASLARKRFTIGHELGHVLLAQNQSEWAWAERMTHSDTERLCDAFAARLLVPDAALQTLGSSPSLVSLRGIAQSLAVSLAVVANRSFVYRKWDCVVATWTLRGGSWEVVSDAGGPWNVREWQVRESDFPVHRATRVRQLVVSQPFRGVATVEVGSWSRTKMVTLIRAITRS